MATQFSNQSVRVGEPVGDYVLVRFIGAGGMGEVYEAQHKHLGTRQAIKFLRRDHVSRPDLLARFEQEARIASTLDSQHIVKVREFRQTEGATPYMVMDLAKGSSLASVLAQAGQLKVARAIDLAHQVGLGLCVAHERRIIHRDLKPDNLYVCPQEDGTELLKILDFGIAKHLGGGDSGPTTETGSNLGTAHYMSPEQAQGARHSIDHRTDIYSLGVILYEMLSGSKPYQGESYNEILIRIVTQRPVPLEAFCPCLPRELVEVVDRAMQREPSKRFQSASEFAVALARLLSNGVESTGLGPLLRPATHPRDSELATLASPEGDHSLPLELGGPHRAEAQRPVWSEPEEGSLAAHRTIEESPRRSTKLGMRFLVTLATTAAVAASAIGLSQLSPHWQVREARRHPTLAALPTGASTAPEAPSTSQFIQLGSVGTTKESNSTSMAPSNSTSTEKAKRTSQANPTALSAKSRNPALSKRIGRGPGLKTPAIDEPLLPNPHAPGVSPVME